MRQQHKEAVVVIGAGLAGLTAAATAPSFAITVMLQLLQPQYAQQIADRVLSQYRPTQVLHAMNGGLYVAGFDADDIVRHRIVDEFDAHLRAGFLRDQFVHHYEEARRRLGPFKLEIGTATQSEFVLSDCPVVTWDRDRDVAGVFYGAAWGEADVIFMRCGTAPSHVTEPAGLVSEAIRKPGCSAQQVAGAGGLQGDPLPSR